MAEAGKELSRCSVAKETVEENRDRLVRSAGGLRGSGDAHDLPGFQPDLNGLDRPPELHLTDNSPNFSRIGSL